MTSYCCSDVGQWLAEHWRKLGPAIKAMDAAEIMRINKDAFNGAIDYFGEIDGWSTDQAKALILKAKEFWNERGAILLPDFTLFHVCE